MSTEILFGKKAIEFRRNRINELHAIVKGNRGWHKDFFARYQHLDTVEGGKLLTSVARGTCDDAEILRCFEDFIPYAVSTQPEWFKKQLKIEIS